LPKGCAAQNCGQGTRACSSNNGWLIYNNPSLKDDECLRGSGIDPPGKKPISMGVITMKTRRLRQGPALSWPVVVLCAGILCYALPVSTAPDARQSALLANNCTQCHARQHTGAPFIGVAEDWQEAIARGEDAMLLNVVQGIRGMPPLGYCSACSEDDFRVLIRVLAGIPEPEGGRP